jgi:hypothetical protein
MLRSKEQRVARQDEMREHKQAPREVAFDEHFTVQELVALWKLSRRTVQRIVEKHPGVVRIGTERPGVRRHFTLRIPAAVAREIYLELTGEVEKPAKGNRRLDSGRAF